VIPCERRRESSRASLSVSAFLMLSAIVAAREIRRYLSSSYYSSFFLKRSDMPAFQRFMHMIFRARISARRLKL
jgi:hypothetical protein